MKRNTSNPALDLRIIEAEDATYELYGLRRNDKYLRVATGCGSTEVRVSVFGDPTDLPPVLLLHGIGSAQVLAAPLIPYLGVRQVFALDWPGHGLSGACVLPPNQDMRVHARTVVESVLDALGLDQVDMVGHSMGAQFSLYSGLELPNRVRRIVLLGAPGAAFEGIRPIAAMKIAAIPKVGPFILSLPMSERAFDRFNDMALGVGVVELYPELRSALRLLGSRTVNATSLASFFCAMVKGGHIRQGVSLNHRDLGRVTQPTCLAWGDEDVFLTPLEAAHSIVAIRNSHGLRVPSAGHAPWLQALDLVGRHVGAHLGR